MEELCGACNRGRKVGVFNCKHIYKEGENDGVYVVLAFFVDCFGDGVRGIVVV